MVPVPLAVIVMGLFGRKQREMTDERFEEVLNDPDYVPSFRELMQRQRYLEKNPSRKLEWDAVRGERGDDQPAGE